MDNDTPKNRKGKYGKKKDQSQKGNQEHRLGNSKWVRLKENMLEKISHKNHQ